MATGWMKMKSLQCKSKALEDVYTPLNNTNTPNPKHHTNFISTSSCRQTVQNLKDIVEVSKPLAKTKPYKLPHTHKPSPPSSKTHHHRSRTSRIEPSIDTTLQPFSLRRAAAQLTPTLTELPIGHPSRNVVEIIFHTSWTSSHTGFPGWIEMIFKVQNASKTISRFEEYRNLVKARSGSGHADAPRCIADGNEVLRFQPLGPSAGEVGLAWVVPSGRDVCTFSGSGMAHESGGGGRGSRAMLVCRVIAGRVGKKVKLASEVSRVGADSVGGEKGELLVLDSRAVLPCFLIIYKL